MARQRQFTNKGDTSDSRPGEEASGLDASNEFASLRPNPGYEGGGDAPDPAKELESGRLNGAEAVDRARGARACEGKVIGVEGAAIAGWAWDPARPYDPIEVEVFAGSVQVGRGSADKFDLDLAKAKLGNGMHRFEIFLDRLPAGAAPFVLRVVISGTDIELYPSITLPTLDDAEHLFSGSEYLGRVTGVVNGMLCGWVLNGRNPHERPVLTLHDGSQTLLTQAAGESVTAATDPGVTTGAYRFELALPVSLLDGGQHLLSVSVGESRRNLAGSPVLFGPSDVASVGRSLASVFDELQRLDRRVESLQPVADFTFFERQMTARVLDRVDMLLNIHRDSIEREMAVMRRQLTHIIAHVPEMESDVILPLPAAVSIEDEPIAVDSTFNAQERSPPLLTYDLSTRTAGVTLSGGLKWSGSGMASGVSIVGSGRIELDGSVSAPASLILSGEGAKDPFEFCGIVTAFDGHSVSGRVDIFDTEAWTFIGTTIGSAARELAGRGLTIQYLSEFERPGGSLALKRIAVFAPGRVPARINSLVPNACVVNLGAEHTGSGWHPVEAGRRGGICWMGGRSEVSFHLRRSRSYRLSIPEVRALTSDIMPKLQISLAGVPVEIEVSPLQEDQTAFAVKGECSLPDDAGENLVLRLSFPREYVRSPRDLGLNEDRRPLTIAVRAVALSVADR